MRISFYLVGIAALLALWCAIGVWYYRHQNGPKRPIGGPISWQKAWWLSLTTFSYFLLPVIVLSVYTGIFWQPLAIIMLGFWLFRAVVQSALMFLLKRWIPPYGIAFNLLFACVMFWIAFVKIKIGWSVPYAVLPVHFIGLMLTDSVFAWMFFQKVGMQTKGAEAIWYASQEPAYDQINRITLAADLIFTATLLYILFRFV